MKRVVVLIDPAHEYGVAFIETVHRVWGLQAVCLYTSRRAAFLTAHRFPELQSNAVAAHFFLSGQSAGQVARLLRRDFSVAAVIPHVEPSVLFASELAGELGLGWAQPEVMARFRDKHALKQHIAAQPRAPRVNRAALVGSVEEVREVLASFASDRFVLKPNDGFGNSDIGFFDHSTDDSLIERHLSLAGSRKMLMEEFIGGPEYYVNGQVDAVGYVTAFEAAHGPKVALNGKENVWDEAVKIGRRTAVFGELAEYVESVVAASGLRRSPFHAEVIIDERGPCLIEIGARLVGAGGVTRMSIQHGGRIDFFHLAAHYYLSAEPFGDLNLDWEHYDEICYTIVLGATSQRGRVWRVEGVEEVEALPEFVRWIHKPVVGQVLVPTTDLFTHPYLLDLQSENEDRLRAAVNQVRRLLVFNRGEADVVALVPRARAMAVRAAQVARVLPRMAFVRPAPLDGALRGRAFSRSARAARGLPGEPGVRSPHHPLG